jgi:hypothetical protein
VHTPAGKRAAVIVGQMVYNDREGQACSKSCHDALTAIHGVSFDRAAGHQIHQITQ